MLLYLLLACDSSGNLSIGKAPEFVLTNQSSDESCAKLTDYCIRVSCSIQNVGNGSGQVAVELTYQESEEKVYTQTIRKELGPGDTTTVHHNFTEAKLLNAFSKNPSVCYLR
jgi:hypothetical protein